MTAAIWIGLGIIALFSIPAWLAIWSRRGTWARPAAVLLFLLAIPTIALAMAESLGRHKPVELAWLPPGDHHVIAAVMKQDVAIWLYLILPDRDEPLPLVLPFSNEMANRIQKAMDGAPEGKPGQFKLRIDPNTADVQAHALPQPAQPPVKDAPEPGMTFTPEE